MATISSMTGFGQGTAEAGGFAVTCDLRAVNHRHLDVKLRLPRELAAHEPALLRRVRAALGRGRVDGALQFVAAGVSRHQLRVDEALARSYATAIEQLAETLGGEPVPLAPVDAARLDGVLTLEPVSPGEAVAEAVIAAADAALAALCAMRRDEGQALARALYELLDRIEHNVGEVERVGVDQLPRLRDRLHDRLRTLLDEVPLDPDRVLAEAALLAEKADVTEELVRLRQHVAAFRDTLGQGGVVGRKLDFLTQELLREANTIGSKAWEAPISLLVIELKSDIERVREQVQNLE